MTWLPECERASLHDVFALRRELYDRYREFASLFWSRLFVAPDILEL